MKKFFAFSLAIVLSACAPFQTEQQKISAACASITSAVQTLTLYKEKLTAHQVKYVAMSLESVNPICAAPVAPVYDDVKYQALVQAAQALNKLATEVK